MQSLLQDIPGGTKHQTCHVCGKGFNAVYDESMRLYPVYCSGDLVKPSANCELEFFGALLRIYHYIHREGQSIPVNKIARTTAFQEKVKMRKDMVVWCLGRGFLALDKLQRVIVPPAVDEISKDIFATHNLNDLNSLQNAVEMLKAAFACVKDKLVPVSEDEMPVQHDDKVEPKIYSQPDTEFDDLPSIQPVKQTGMATAMLREDRIKTRK